MVLVIVLTWVKLSHLLFHVNVVSFHEKNRLAFWLEVTDQMLDL